MLLNNKYRAAIAFDIDRKTDAITCSPSTIGSF
jgi:hypothetical protein